MALEETMIKAFQSKLGSYLNSDLVEEVLKRLDSFGYTVKDTDDWLLGFAIQKARSSIENECNTSGIPDGLGKIAVDMACGEFLLTKKQTGQLELGDLDLTGVVSSIKEGDTQINFGGGSDEEKVQSLINYLLTYGKGELVCYRRIRW